MKRPITYSWWILLLCCMQTNSFNIKNHNKADLDRGYDNCNMFTNGEQTILNHIIKPNMLVFDVGANIGEWTERVKELHKNVKIFAFEPVPTSFEKLSTKFANKSMRISCFNIALGKTSSMQEIYVYNGDEGSQLCSFYHRPILDKNLQEKPHKIAVKTLTLDDFCSDQHIEHIDFLKIDTEGAELDVLLGAKNLLSSHTIDYIQFEYGGTYQDAHTTLQQVYNLLKPHNYQIFLIVPDGLVHLDQWRTEYENYRYSNYLAIHNQIIKEFVNEK